MESYPVEEWLLYFYIYCFCGWIWESCYVSVKERKLVNRGFMKGPLLPIYGSGAICILWVTLPVRGNYLLMALVGMVAATLLEYATGAAMEALFKVRYWDYSTEFMNLNGYVCLKSTVCWGVMTLLVVYIIHPPVEQLVTKLPVMFQEYLVMVITVFAAADFATSFKAAIDFREVLEMAERLKGELKEVQQKLDALESQLTGGIAEEASRKKEGLMRMGAKGMEAAQGLKERTLEVIRIRSEEDDKRKEGLQKEWQELTFHKRLYMEKLQNGYTRSIHGLLKRNPGTVSKKHSEALEELKGAFAKYRKDKDGQVTEETGMDGE